MTEEKIYRTDFENQRNTNVPVFDYEGRLLFALAPLASGYLEAWDPRSTWAKWEKVIFRAGGTTKCFPNSAWEDSYKGWQIQLFNDTPTAKAIRIDGQFVRVFPGVPRSVPCPLNEVPTIYVKSIRWTSETYKELDSTKEYMIDRTRDVKKIENRGVREMQKIKSSLKDQASKKMEETVSHLAPPTPSDSEEDDS